MATLYKRGKSYYLNWRLQGKLQRRSLGKISKSEAETILHAKEVEMRTGVNILNASHFHMFEAVAKQYLNWHKHEYPDSHTRIAQITEQHLIPYFELKPAALNPLDVENYKTSRRSKVATETINKEIRTIKAILNKAVEWDLIEKNTIKSVKPIKNKDSSPSKYFTATELNEIYEGEYGAIWRLLANTGMRRTEAQNLKWVDVHHDKIRILSTSKDRTKSGKWREVPLSGGALDALIDLANDIEYVLPRMTGTSLSRILRKKLIKLKIEGNLHSLRHTFCSHLVMKGIPLQTVQILAGHANATTTQKYAHLAPDYLQASVAVLEI